MCIAENPNHDRWENKKNMCETRESYKRYETWDKH